MLNKIAVKKLDFMIFKLKYELNFFLKDDNARRSTFIFTTFGGSRFDFLVFGH